MRLIFHKFDNQKDGVITEDDWTRIMDDECYECYLRELCRATRSTKEQLSVVFEAMSVGSRGRRCTIGEKRDGYKRVLHYERFIELMEDKDRPADKQLLMKLLAKIEKLEARLWHISEHN